MFDGDFTLAVRQRALPSFRSAGDTDDFQAADDFLECVFMAVAISTLAWAVALIWILY